MCVFFTRILTAADVLSAEKVALIKSWIAAGAQ